MRSRGGGGAGELDRDMMYGRQSDHLELGSWNREGKLNIASEAEAAGAASSRVWRRYQTPSYSGSRGEEESESDI